MKKVKSSDLCHSWTNIIIEGYCLGTGNPDDEVEVPDFCNGKLQSKCLEENCPRFGYCDSEKEEYNWLHLLYKDKFDEEKFKKVWNIFQKRNE